MVWGGTSFRAATTDQNILGTCMPSTPEMGSRFWFTVTLEEGRETPTTAARIDNPDGSTLTVVRSRLYGRRILLVEDHDFNRMVAQELLEDAVIQCLTVENGAEALTCLASEAADGVLMDMQMPVMDGLEATRRLRADPSLREIPVVAMTAYASEDDERRCREAGGDDFVSKPVRPAILYAVLLRNIGRRGGGERQCHAR